LQHRKPVLFFVSSHAKDHWSVAWRCLTAEVVLFYLKPHGQMKRCSMSKLCCSQALPWPSPAVAPHRGSELLHQNDAFIVKGSLQHGDDRHTCQQEIKPGNPNERSGTPGICLQQSNY
uniref:Uncharacterized protein n=1 Tax=Phocoena sinus TaxID=42100 RepID=A0A8C9CQB5_PHOSS